MNMHSLSAQWHTIHPQASHDMLGMLPLVFNADDPRPAIEQANDRYSHGGGWSPFNGFKIVRDVRDRLYGIQYPGDPVLRAIAKLLMKNGDSVYLFEGSWVLIRKPDGSHEIARMD